MGIILARCNTNPPVEDAARQDEERQREEGVVSLTQEQITAIGMQTGPLSWRYLGASIKVNGRLEVPPQNEAKVSAYLGGNVRQIQVIEGDQVQKGQTLAYLVHPDLVTIQQDYQTALHRLEFLEKEYARKKKLFDSEIGSGREFQEVESEFKALQSQAAALKVKLNILDLDADAIAAGNLNERIAVKAPISGYIRVVAVVTGQYVQPQQELFEIVDNSHIHADLMVYERDIARVRKGQKVIFTAASMPGKELTATIYSVGKAFEEDPKAVHVHAEIDSGSGDLILGTYLQGRIITDQPHVLALPEGGVVTEGERSYIFILADGKIQANEAVEAHAHEGDEVQTDEHAGVSTKHEEGLAFRMIEVGTGITEAGFIEIKPLTDLPDSVQVVTEGAYYLLAEMKKGEADHIH